MSRVRRAALAGLAVIAASAAIATTSGPAEASGTLFGCPRGYVCIYAKGHSYKHGHPTHEYRTYGAHNLHNQIGTHDVFNNQYGDAAATLMSGYNGHGHKIEVIPADSVWRGNLTPVNSIVLTECTENGGCA